MRRILFTLSFILAAAATNSDAEPSLVPGSVFRDCPNCPEMVVIPAGSFMMGDDGHHRERPVHRVTFARPFAVGKFDVTFDQWDACANDGACSGYHPDDHGWGRGTRPVINVTWDQAQEYIFWLSKKTGKKYRLLSEAEFEYVDRANTTTVYWWGDDVGRTHAVCQRCGSPWDDKQTAPSGSFPANAFGVYDTTGELTEWVEDRWNSNYEGAPADGSAWETGDRERRVMRSGSWYNSDDLQRSAYRNGDSPQVKNHKIGFRVALTL